MDDILEPLRPGREGPLGLVLGMGLTTEEYNTFPQQLPPNSLMQILCLREFKNN
jgi:hypothetical protein